MTAWRGDAFEGPTTESQVAEGLELLEAFVQIKDLAKRRKLIEIAQSMPTRTLEELGTDLTSSLRPRHH